MVRTRISAKGEDPKGDGLTTGRETEAFDVGVPRPRLPVLPSSRVHPPPIWRLRQRPGAVIAPIGAVLRVGPVSPDRVTTTNDRPTQPLAVSVRLSAF